MEEYTLTPLTRENVPTDSILDLADDRLSLRTRRKPVLTRRRLPVLITLLAALGICGGAVYLVISAARYFWRMVLDPHWKTTTSYPFSAVTSYYGGQVPQFDVVASVFIRFGKRMPNGDEFRWLGNFLPEEWAFGDWQSLYSQIVFSRISLNSTEKSFGKTVNLTIPLDILSQFYEPLTFFPEIVNTFVIVPSDPDPVLSSLDPPRVEMAEFEPWRPMDPFPNPDLWTKHYLRQLARPTDPLFNYTHGGSRLENASQSLNAFYDSGAVKEFALRPVIDEWASWGTPRWVYEDERQLNQTEESKDAPDPRRWLSFKRDVNIKIKSRSWLSTVKETPKYDYERYNRKRHDVGIEQLTITWDFLNPWVELIRAPFSDIGHYRSQITQYFDMVLPDDYTEGDWVTVPDDISFYGPYMTLRDHAAGSEDWVILPRINESSNTESADPFIFPWHITFDLLSIPEIMTVDTVNENSRERIFGNGIYDPYDISAYSEFNTLETMDFLNAIFGNSHTYTKRPVLRSVFFVIGGLIRYPLGSILQIYYLLSRSSSTGLSLPPTILYLIFSSLYEALSYWIHRYDRNNSAWLAGAVQVINVVSIWRWTCLWWGIGFIWNGWSGLIPVGLAIFGRTHSERTSRRSDQKFTWTQRGLFVLILTIILTHLPELPHLISPTYLRAPDKFYSSRVSHSSLKTILTWSRRLRLPEYGASLRTSLSMMAMLSQILLNWRSKTFAGSIPAFSWTQVIGTALLWTPTIFHSIFGKFHATDPLGVGIITCCVLTAMLPALLVLTLSAFQTAIAHPSVDNSHFLSKRQTTTTAALTDLIDGPVSYVTTGCTTLCASMVAQSNSCTEDECACAASAVTVTCMNCEITAGSARATILAGFNAYANTCVSEGYLTTVPTLTTATAATSSSSASVSSSSSASSVRSSSSAVVSSSTSARAAATTAAGATGLTAINTWLASVGTSACVSDCAAIRSDVAACTTDTCACTQAIINDGQTCESCVELNEEGYFGTTQITQIEALWKTAENTCSLTTALTTAAAGATAVSSASSTTTATRTKSTSGASSDVSSYTGIPFQSYYAPTTTTTATTTSGVVAQASSKSTSGTSFGVRTITGLDRWTVLLLGSGVLGFFWI
ncbi:hypothetical protein [Phaffia rhodozyma]|uniref:Uncharacterized protein n=1 Tax=Phaffia rhodozyma TaxID=264483 RepID=A0A0F7STW9_PHARH|nr:hypothetical protein [Phaffia rhodozyma]